MVPVLRLGTHGQDAEAVLMAQVDLFGNRKAVNNESVIASPAAKALSVCQPFAALIVAGWKSIELRSWNTKMRGTFLVHAAKKVRTADVKRLGTMGDAPDGHSWVTGAIIGVAELYDVRHYDSVEDVDKDAKAHMCRPGRQRRVRFHAARFQAVQDASAVPWQVRVLRRAV